MTPLAAPPSRQIPSPSVAEPEDSMPRNVRVRKETWLAFGAAVGDRRKSEWVVPTIESIVRDPQLWKEFRALAELRGDDMADALLKAISKYNADR